jgi:hypothetical protein
VMCALSTTTVFLAKTVDIPEIGRIVFDVNQNSVETLLTIISASMLVIATFAVASMVAAYASASNTATPRSSSLVISDDVSQNALSTFIGAFIYSIVAGGPLLARFVAGIWSSNQPCQGLPALCPATERTRDYRDFGAEAAGLAPRAVASFR